MEKPDHDDDGNDAQAGSCWACGYPLRGLPADARRCPDCGRAFDPADARSVNRRRPLGAIAGRLLGPPGWPTVGLAAIAAALVGGGTGTVTGFTFRLDDWQLFRDWLRHPAPWKYLSPHWRAYAAGTLLAALVTAWSIVRLVMRWGVVALRRPPEDLRRRRSGLMVAVGLLLGLCYAWIACGGPPRLGREWAAALLKSTAGQTTPTYAQVKLLPFDISQEQRTAVIRALALAGDSPAERRAAMTLRWLGGPTNRDPSLWQAAAEREPDADLCAAELRFLAMHREPASIPFVARFLEDGRPAVRAAAADALGLIHCPAYAYGFDEGDWDRFARLSMPGTPPIDVAQLMTYGARQADDGGWSPKDFPFFTRSHPLAEAHRARLTRMMLDGEATTDEREAAAALLPQPPNGYQLRFAEWGVWLNENGSLKAARGVEEDVPPFVHRTGNPIAQMGPYVQPVMIVTKPVIHLTVSHPMSVDVEVLIRRGRPWFAYPMPDDFGVLAESRQGAALRVLSGPTTVPAAAPTAVAGSQPAPLLAGLDPPVGLPSLPMRSLRSGYPWAGPPHRKSGPTSGIGSPFNDIAAWGVHWQSVIVVPAKQRWMTEPAVGDDPKHAWWRRLRDVDCSWVSSRGESERFLYYDGPTQMKLPITMRLDGETIRNESARLATGEEVVGAGCLLFDQRRTFRERGGVPESGWWALAVRVARTGQVESAEVAPGFDAKPFDRTDHPILDGADAAERALRETIAAWGLMPSEAAGLLDTWREPFFKKPGTRVLMVMPQRAYDQFCPLVVRPAPTERVRVGIVVTELGPN